MTVSLLVASSVQMRGFGIPPVHKLLVLMCISTSGSASSVEKIADPFASQIS